MSRNAGAATTPPKICAARLVDRDEDDEPRRARGDDPDERGDVVRVRVAAARIGLRGRAGLAGDQVAGHGGLAARARGETTPWSIPISSCGDAPSRRRAGAEPSPGASPADVVDEVRLDPDAAVRERAVRGRHLDRRHRDPLADRDVADRRARPAARPAATIPGLSPGKSIPVGRAEAEARDPARRAAPGRAARRA